MFVARAGASVAFPEPVSQSQHQVIRVFEAGELIAHVQKQAVGQVRLQREDLIEGIGVWPFAKDVASDAQVDGEDGHHHLRADRQAHGKLLDEGRTVEADAVGVGRVGIVGDVLSDVGAFVVLRIERQACPEVTAEVAHGVEVQADDAERTWHQYGRTVLRKYAFLARGAVQHQVVTDVGLEDMSACGVCLLAFRLLLPAEVAGDAYVAADGVDALVGIAGIAVGEVRQADAGFHAGLRVDLPVQEKAQIDVGIGFRAYHVVIEVVDIVVFLPSERSAEVPFIVQREPSAEGSDARGLEHVDCHGIA